jgi:hypothetical protein
MDRGRLALIVLGAALSAGLAAPHALAAGTRATIVLPAQPTEVEQFAAQELARCLQAACDCEVVVVDAASGQMAAPVFWLGTVETPSRLAPLPAGQAAARADRLIEDGVCLYGDGRDVVLLGDGPRGALNAVYTYLEQQIGFHWPDPGQEFVPPAAELKTAGLDAVSNPAFAYRGIAIHGACGPEWFIQILDWLAKNRMNAFQLFPGHYESLRPQALGDITKRGLLPNIGGHSREFFFPAETYYPEHPEWFALLEGERVLDTQLCYSNLASVPQYAANIIAYLKTRPEIHMASLWPSDGYGFCECQTCAAGQTTDILLNYCNEVTQQIVAELPQMKTEFLSYIHYTVPPREVRPHPQLVPTYCEYWSRSQFHPITEGRNSNAKCREELRTWIDVSAEATLFSYYGDDCIKRFVYNPLMDVIVTDMRYYKIIHLAGHFVLLTNPESWWSNAPHLYAYARTSWDPEVDLETLEADYYDSLYGPASPAMRAHARDCRALFDMKTVQGGVGENVVWGQRFPAYDTAKDSAARLQGAQAVDKLRAHLSSAAARASGEYVTERIRKLQAAADYVGWLYEFICESHCVEADPTPESQERLLALAEKGLELEVVAEDDRRGYRSARNVLIATARRLTGRQPETAHSTPEQRKLYQEQGIWRWSTEDIVPSGEDDPRRIVIDVTDRITGPGTYEVVWQYLDGADGLFILSTGLYTADIADPGPEALRPLVVDEHPGFTGGGNSANVYSLTLEEHDPARRYYVLGVVYDEREFDTYGHVLMRETARE